MRVSRSWKITLILVLMVALLAGVAVAMVFWLRHPSSSPKPPTSRPPEILTSLSALVNNLNADMRSCEIASWFVDKLAAQVSEKDALPCDSAHAAFDFRGIADKIPGANEVTKRMTIKALEDFVKTASKTSCNAYGAVTGDHLSKNLRLAKAFCSMPSGTLLSLYPAKSKVALP